MFSGARREKLTEHGYTSRDDVGGTDTHVEIERIGGPGKGGVRPKPRIEDTIQ